MSDETSKIVDAAHAVKGVFEAVPIYQDAMQPAAKQIGKGLETVAKTLLIALAPFKVLVWGYEEIEDFLRTRVAEKLQDTPIERIQSPAAHVAVPLLEALRYTGNELSLREMYASLLATAMDSAKANNAHPAFVEIIKQLTPDEAKIVGLFASKREFPLIDITQQRLYVESETVYRHFSLIANEVGLTCPQQLPVYIDNLCRLGLTEIPPKAALYPREVYLPLWKHPFVEEICRRVTTDSTEAILIDKCLMVTSFGEQFCTATVESTSVPTRGRLVDTIDEPRFLNDQQMGDLQTKLQQIPPERIGVFSFGNDSEANQFRDQLGRVFESAGWPADVRTAVAAIDVEGVSLDYFAGNRSDEPPGDETLSLHGALESCGVQTRLRPHAEPGNDYHWYLCVGQKPRRVK